jgi:hypothetical protein
MICFGLCVFASKHPSEFGSGLGMRGGPGWWLGMRRACACAVRCLERVLVCPQGTHAWMADGWAQPRGGSGAHLRRLSVVRARRSAGVFLKLRSASLEVPAAPLERFEGDNEVLLPATRFAGSEPQRPDASWPSTPACRPATNVRPFRALQRHVLRAPCLALSDLSKSKNDFQCNSPNTNYVLQGTRPRVLQFVIKPHQTKFRRHRRRPRRARTP